MSTYKGKRWEDLFAYNTKKESILVGDVWYVNFPYDDKDQIKENGDSMYGELRPGLVVEIDNSKERCFKVVKATNSTDPDYIDEKYISKVGDPSHPIRLNCKEYAELSSNNFDRYVTSIDDTTQFDDAKTKYENAIKNNESTVVTFENAFLEGVTIGAQNTNKDPLYRVTYEGKGIYQAYKNTLFKDKKFDEWKKFKNDPKVNWLETPTVYGNDKVKHESYFTDAGLTKFKKETLPLITKVLDNKKIQYTTVENLNSKNITYNDQFQVVVQIQEINKELIKEGLAPVRLYNYVPFIPEKETDQQLQVQNEGKHDTNLIFSEDDIYVNFNDWETKKSNVLFVIGLSGGGKTTLANKMAEKYKCNITFTDTLAFKIAGHLRAIEKGYANWDWLKENDVMLYKYLKAKKIDVLFLSDPVYDVTKTKPARSVMVL